MKGEKIMGTKNVTFTDSQIELAHGAGGKASRKLIDGLLVPYLMKKSEELADVAIVPMANNRVAFTTDSYVVSPLTFNGGSIGELAVNGTVNDLAMGGAKPLAIVSTLIIEEGLPSDVLEREVKAMGLAAEQAGVSVVGGDTKVVEHNHADKLFITTAGIGLIDERVALSAKRVEPGDKIILSGPIGDHGITILLARGELDLEADIKSDTRSVWPFVSKIIDIAGPGIKWMRDPTRGGVATALNELAIDANVTVELQDKLIKIHPAVRGSCEILGLDPLHIANEGQFIAVVSPEYEKPILNAMKEIPGGEEVECIGEIQKGERNIVIAHSQYGGTRSVDMLVGDPLPRIC